MTDKRVSLKDIAREAGVSAATVSMVLRGKGNIAAETRDRIKRLALDMRYTPQRTKESRSVAILEYECFSYQWNFIKPFITSISKTLFTYGRFPLVFHLEQGESSESLCSRIIESGASALCSIHFGDNDLFKRMADAGIPVIILNNSSYQNEYSTVCADDFQGCYTGCLHLLEKKHRHILYLDYLRPDINSCVIDRYMGFKKGINEHRICFPDENRITFDLDDKKALQSRFRTILEQKPEITALFIHDDYLAIWIIDELERMGIRYPEDISIIAPGDTLDYELPLTPQITTIQIDSLTMGDMAAKITEEKIISLNSPIRTIRVSPIIVDRGSCREISP